MANDEVLPIKDTQVGATIGPLEFVTYNDIKNAQITALIKSSRSIPDAQAEIIGTVEFGDQDSNGDVKKFWITFQTAGQVPSNFWVVDIYMLITGINSKIWEQTLRLLPK